MSEKRIWINLRFGSSAIEVIRGQKNIVIRYRRKHNNYWLFGKSYMIPIFFAKFLFKKDVLEKLGLGEKK